jgi:extradiol dioxygenase family protein
MSCKHTRTTERWVTQDYFGEEIDGEWQYDTVSTTVDIDLHRYKCTQCGEVMYYSGRAREYYEQGVKFDWIQGLKE